MGMRRDGEKLGESVSWKRESCQIVTSRRKPSSVFLFLFEGVKVKALIDLAIERESTGNFHLVNAPWRMGIFGKVSSQIMTVSMSNFSILKLFYISFFIFLFAGNVFGQRATSIGNAPVLSTTPTDQCNKTVGIYEEVTSPALTPENVGKPMLCHYRFRPFRTNLRDWVLRIRFTSFKVGRLLNESTCEVGYIQIIDGNGKGGIVSSSSSSSLLRGREPGKFCGEIEQPQTFISETSTVRLVFYTSNFTSQTYFRFDSRAEQQYEVYLRYGQHPELFPNRRGEVVPSTYCERVFRDCRMQTCYVQSPGYPGLYPRNLHCKYSINTRLPFIKLHIENEEFNVDGQRCENLMLCPMKAIGNDCPNDYIKIYDGKDEKAPVIGVFCGVGKFPFSIIGTGSDLFVEFVTSAAGPLSGNTGFHFNVGHWPGHVETSGKSNGTCDWIFTSSALAASGDKQGLFWSVSHWYPPNTRCSYLMLGDKDEIVRLLFPSFRIEKIDAPVRKWDGDCSESLTIYDASFADDSKIIKTFCDTSRPPEKYDFVSTSNALYVLFESKTGSYAGSSLYYWSSYDFFNNTHYGESVQGTTCDEVFSSWNKAEGRFASPLNTLIYKNDEGKVVSCRYRFVSMRRLYARVVVKIENVNFKYNQDNCLNCWVDRVDKITMIDPLHQQSRNKKNGTGSSKTASPHKICICKENIGHHSFPVTLISDGEEAEVTLKIDPRHSLANYFKTNVPIFEGSYRFIHGPLCGPTILGPSSDGKLRFPFYYNPALRDLPTFCLWELHVTPTKDLWINLEKLVFAISSKSCADAKLEFYLPNATPPSSNNPATSYTHSQQHHSSSSYHQPLLTLCGDSSASSRTEISSQLPILSSEKLQQGGPVTIKLEASSAAKLNFIISWTELTQLPRNPDGTLKTSKLEAKEDCGFLCPGPQGICIDRSLVCNGVQNCPNTTSGQHDESEGECKMNDSRFVVGKFLVDLDWTTASVVGGLGALVVVIICLGICRCCCGGGKKNRREPGDEVQVVGGSVLVGGQMPMSRGNRGMMMSSGHRYHQEDEDDYLT